MAEALIELLLEQLVTVAFDYTKEAVILVLNTETEVKKFSSNLKAIQAVLEDAEKQQVEKASVRNWLYGLKDVSYEMVNVLDEWNTEILKQKAKGVAIEKKKSFKKVCSYIPSNCFCFGLVNKATHLYKIATQIKELNEKLTFIAAQKDQYGFHQSSIRSKDDQQLNQPLKTSSFVDISTTFGREKVTADLLNKLLSDSSEEGKRVLVIPIVGMGGMGKTTLAQLAYNNEDVKTYFEKRIWVCVSDPFDGAKIAKAIISGTGNDAPNSTELQDILQCMSRSLEGKKYLIVLDDVWTEDLGKWESLKLPIIMQTCANGSKILVTTRKEGVAKMMRAITHMIHLEKLSDEICLALFNSIAYLEREEDEANGCRAIGEKIAKKCNGLPLAAKTLGALMQYKKTRREWQEVLDSKIWDLKEVEQQVFQPLLLSYYELAPAVKRCLLYCATLPKDYRFNKHNLIELWMSHDYLSGKNYKEKEETGQYVFNTLVMRSFFQDVVEEASYLDKSITIFCKMHDIVHDFVQFLNKNECFTMEPTEAIARMVIRSEEVRHLSLMYAPYGSPLLDFISPVNCRKLHTLATFDSRLSGIDIKAISQLKCLRTLNLSHNDIQELPEGLGELIHLRYLDLSGNGHLEKLPDSFGNLYNLQTLCLTDCRMLQKLPEDMGNLINLRHLKNKRCYELEYLPRGIARLTSLQTLNWCPVVHDSGPGEDLKLGDLANLDQLQGSLIIYMRGNLKDTSEAQKACLWNKKLYHLELCFSSSWDKQSHVQVLEALRPHQDLEILKIIWYRGTTEPSWMISLQNLRSLSLVAWDGCEFLPPLGKLPFLEEVSVSRVEKVKSVGDEFLGIMGTQTSSSSVLFPKLRALSFTDLGEWKQWEGVGGWTESSGDEIRIMPCLVSLEIVNCPKLMNLPVFLQKTPVRKILIGRCRRSIITPVWPENCDVDIRADLEDPIIPDITESRVETEMQIDSQRDEEITMSPQTAKLKDCCQYVLRGSWIVLPQEAAAGLWRYGKSYRLR